MTQTSRESFLTLRIAEPLHGQLKGTAERCRQSVSEVARGILVDAMLRKIGVHSSGYVADTRRPLMKAIGAAA
jgi:hypothetical protein